MCGNTLQAYVSCLNALSLPLVTGRNEKEMSENQIQREGQQVLMSGYLVSNGFSFPAAMGAWAATQDQDD